MFAMSTVLLNTVLRRCRTADAAVSDRPAAPRVLRLLALVLVLVPVVAAAPMRPQGAAPAPGPASTPVPAALVAAQQAFARKDWKQAAAQGEIAAKSPIVSERTAALRLQAKAEVNLSQFPAAEGTLQALLTLQPGDATALYMLGFTLHREDKPRPSLEAFTRAAVLRTPTADDLKVVGLDYVLLNDYPDALHWLQRSVAMDPRNAEAWYDLGRTQMHEGQSASAETSFRRTLALQPAHVKALDNLGLSLEAQNRPDEALKAYAASIAAQDSAGPALSAASGSPRLSEQPLLNFGTLLNSGNRFAEAAEVLARASKLAPASARCWEELARAEAGLARNPEARAAMERAVSLDPNNPRLHYQLGRIYRNLDLAVQAKAEFARSASLYGGKSSAPEP